MKYFFYTVMFIGSLGAAGAVLNPSMVRQGAALLGLELPDVSKETAENPPDDQLSQFLSQYPFVQNQDNPEIVPATPVPQTVIADYQYPAADPVPIAAPPIAAAIPESEQATSAQVYASQANLESWDGEASVPIAFPAPSEATPPDPIPSSTDWSGPAQPYQPSAPHQSVYDTIPVQEPEPAAVDPFLAGSVPPNPVPLTSPPVQVPPAVDIPPSPPQPVAELISTPPTAVGVPMLGTEMVARVGRQVILMGDILPKLRRAALKVVAENFKQMSAESQAKVSPEEIEQVVNVFVERQYPAFLQEQILATLVYCDYEVSKSKAEKDFLNENIGNEFDRNQVLVMLKEFNVENMAALKQYLSEKLGSSLERERRLWIQEQIVRQWIGLSVQRATGECTHDEMMEFYEANQAMFTTPARARWQELTVLFADYPSEHEAREKIRWMGNQVSGGAPFEEIAKANSDGFTADKGGVWDWTSKGSLTSEALEQAIFTQPIEHLSPEIIQSDKGLHIIKVLERQEVYVVPFVEAQVTIREKIRSQRIQRYQEEYFADLRRRFPMVVLKEQINLTSGMPQTADAAAW